MDMLPLEPGSPFEASFLNKTPVDRWDVDDVLEWLMGVGCGEYNAQFRANHIDGQVLLVLERSSLKQLINRVGDRIKIQQGIKRLRIRENLSLPASASHANFEDLSAGVSLSASQSMLPSIAPSASASSTSINAAASGAATTQDISIVYPDGNSRTVGLPSTLRTATDAKHIILKKVFPSIGKTAAAAWAISRGDHILSEQETLALAQSSTNTGVLRIHQVDPPSTTTSRQRGSHRPTSRHVSAHLKEYFPNVPSGELEQTVRNSVMLTRRLSTYDPTALDLRRLSNMPSIQGPTAAPSPVAPVAPKAPPKGRPLTLHSPSGPNQSLNTDAQQLLDQFKAEEMTPSRWIRGQMIGSGSFGTVYMGMNAFTGELLAVKQVEIPENEIDEGRKKKMVDALKHEVHLMRGFDHANIVQYRGFKHETNTLNIFLEYVPGGSLVSMLNQYGSFEEKLVSHYVGQILAGIEYLHNRQVIHRDIKGANILVDDKGNCKISDFGLSKKMETQQLLQSNRQSMQGSTFWMAPEVVKQMAPTMKSDIWSLGCVVIELLTGSHPFPQLTQMQAIFKLGNLVQPEIPNDCSPEAKDFLKKTLEVDRAKRPNATELRGHKFAERT